MDIQLPNSVDLTAILGEYFVHHLIDKAYSSLKNLLKANSTSTDMTKVDFEDNFRYELTKTINWAHEVNLNEFNYSQSINSIYVELELYFSLRRSHLNEHELNTQTFSEIYNNFSQHLIILGQPGAGKTTTLKHICYSLLFEERSKYKNIKVPLVIRLRDLNNELIGVEEKFGLCIFRYIFTKLGINIDYNKTFKRDQKRTLIIKSVITILEELNILLILDGFDEVIDNNKRQIIINELKELTLGLSSARIILTSRLGEFYAHFDNSLVFEICSLNTKQIQEFAMKRFRDDSKANLFVTQVTDSTYYDTALRPLTLAYLTLIYEKYGKIHDKPKEIYKRILRLLIEDWNIQNSVLRESKYSNFDSDRKFEFLAALSYNLTVNYGTTSFTDQMLADVYSSICSEYSLPQSQVNKVIAEIENHNGLFIQTFYNTFEFSHKSLQEYLTADYLIRQPIIDDFNSLLKLPNELAISIALSADPTKYLSYLVFKVFKNSVSTAGFYKIFCTRLIIEKPDYKVSVELVCAFLYMYKVIKFITDKNIKDPFNEQTYQTDGKIGSLVEMMEDFFGTDVFLNSYLIFKKYYDLLAEPNRIDYHKSTDTSYKTTIISFFKKIKNKSIETSTLPIYLPVNNQMLNQLEGNFSFHNP